MARGLEDLESLNERAHAKAMDDSFERAVAVVNALEIDAFVLQEGVNGHDDTQVILDRTELIALVQGVLLRDIP